MEKKLDQEVIEKCVEVLQKTHDGNDLSPAQLAEVQFCTNNYYKFGAKDKATALASLEAMLPKVSIPSA